MRLFGKRLVCCGLLCLAVIGGQSAIGPALAQEVAAKGEGGETNSAGQISPAVQTPAAKPQAESSTNHEAANLSEAQPNEANATEAGKSPAVVEEPPIFYARDKQGRLVPLLGFSYEELLEFLRQKKSDGAAAKPRGYSLEQLEITGDVEQDHVNLVATYKIRLDDAGAVDVPLVGGGAVLRQPADYKGDGQQSVSFNAQSGWYTVNLRGAARSEHQITLKLLAPIKSSAGQNRLELNLPTAAASQLTLRVPGGPIEVTDHSGMATTEAKPRATGGTEVSALGLGPAVALAWKAAGADSAAPVLEATGQVLATIDSRSLQFETTLTVRSFGRQFDKFHVKLPRGAQLAGEAPAGAGYTLSSSGDADSQVVEVQLAQKTAGPVEIKLRAERAYDVTQPNSVLDLAGFEIVEAAPHRQWGQIAVAIAGDWQPVWGARNRVRQIAELPEALRRNDVVAGFEYFGQPATLAVRLAPRRTRIAVEPEYIYFVDANQLRLEARLKYNIRGAKTSALEIALPGWEIDEIGPVEIVDTDTSLANRSNEFTIPLLQPTSGEAELTLKAHRFLPKNAARFEIGLPLPTADVVSPAIVALAPADNVRLRPREGELQGLSRSAVPPRMKLPTREQTPLFFRGEQPQATLVCDLERLPQSISATVDSNLELRRDEVRVEQTFRYRVEHEAASELSFDVPAALLNGAPLEFLLDGQSLVQSSSAAGDSESLPAQIQVELPEPRIGELEITARYRLPEATLLSAPSVPVSVPLAMPANMVPDANRLTVSCELALQVKPLDNAWDNADLSLNASTDNGRALLSLVAAQPTSQITLAVRAEDVHGHGATTVQRAWLQTWLSGGVRQDRAVYRFITTADELKLTLPGETAAGKVEIRLDQRMLSPDTTGGNVRIKMSDVPNGRPHVLEVRYQFDDASLGGAIAVDMPKLAGSLWMDRLYWQLVLPRTDHLLSTPAELTPEFDWTWTGWGWARRAAWEQADLEKWVGATTASPLPEATNRYLFSANGNLQRFTAKSVARWEIVFLASAIVLIVGLLVIHVSAVRRPSAMFVAAVVLVAFAVWLPDTAMLLAQAAVLGLVLLVVALWLRRTMAGRRTPGMVVPASSSSIVERSSARTKYRSLELTAASTTAAATQLELPAAPAEGG